MNAKRSNHTNSSAFGGSSMVSVNKLYCGNVSRENSCMGLKSKVYNRKPGVVSNKCCAGRGEGTPPQTPDAVLLDALPKYGSPIGTLRLEGCLQSINRGKDHSETSSAGHQHISIRITGVEQIDSYQREAKIVFIGDGRCFKYEFDCSNAIIPVFAAVSPNLAAGPGELNR